MKKSKQMNEGKYEIKMPTCWIPHMLNENVSLTCGQQLKRRVLYNWCVIKIDEIFNDSGND